jgi:hypothetical protein
MQPIDGKMIGSVKEAAHGEGDWMALLDCLIDDCFFRHFCRRCAG